MWFFLNLFTFFSLFTFFPPIFVPTFETFFHKFTWYFVGHVPKSCYHLESNPSKCYLDQFSALPLFPQFFYKYKVFKMLKEPYELICARFFFLASIRGFGARIIYIYQSRAAVFVNEMSAKSYESTKERRHKTRGRWRQNGQRIACAQGCLWNSNISASICNYELAKSWSRNRDKH